jgi:hypothetical protein
VCRALLRRYETDGFGELMKAKSADFRVAGLTVMRLHSNEGYSFASSESVTTYSEIQL